MNSSAKVFKFFILYKKYYLKFFKFNKGSYGSVYKAIKVKTNFKVAVKIISKENKKISSVQQR